jgi:hypothetical protein
MQYLSLAPWCALNQGGCDGLGIRQGIEKRTGNVGRKFIARGTFELEMMCDASRYKLI